MLASLLASCAKRRPPQNRTFYFPGSDGRAATVLQQTSSEPAALPAPAPSTGYSGLGVASVPPEVLAKFAPKPLPPQEARRIQSMLDVRAPSSGRISPDGKRLYFAWNITGTQQIFRLDAPMGFPTQLTGGEETSAILDITPDGKTLVLSRDRNGEENPGIYLARAEGGPLTVVQHQPGVQTVFDFMSDDGKKIYFHANDKKASDHTIYAYDIAAQKREVVFEQPGLWSLRDERKGKLLLQKSVGSNMAELYELDPKTNALSPVIGQNEREDYDVAYGAAEGEHIVLTPKLGEFRRLYSFKGGKLTPITPELKFDVSSFSIDRQRRRILYTVNEAGYSRPYGLDAATKKNIKLPKLPTGDQVAFGATSGNGRFTAVQIDPGVSPVESYVIDWEGSSLRRWHKPSSPEIDTTKFARVSLESYPARDGAQIPLFVRTPVSCEGPCPVVVAFHGGPEGQSIPGFSTRAQLFVDAGFVYVEPNVRGSEGYGKTWLHADDGPKRLAIITDIEDAAKFVRTRFAKEGRAPKVGIYGGSYGGYSVLIGMSMFAGTYDAGVSVVGISSLVTFLENTAPYRRILRTSEYGDPTVDRQALIALSPITYVDKVSAPLLLLQGATDPRVPVGESIQFHEAASRKGVASELMIFPDEGHGMRKRANVVLSLGHTIRFFEEHLKGKRSGQ